MAYSFVPPAATPGQVRVLLAANRLEARPRSPEFNRALRAEVRDSTWLLARQWQMHEFRAEDRGTPAEAAVRLRQQPLGSLTLPEQPTRVYDPVQQPLEAAVEAQPRPIGLGLRLQMGQLWLRLLRASLTPTGISSAPSPAQLADRQAAIDLWANTYRLELATATNPVDEAQQTTTPEVLTLMQLAGTHALDGYRLYTQLLAPYATALASKLADNDQLAVALAGYPLLTNLLPTFTSLSQQQGVNYLNALSENMLDNLARQYVLTVHRLYLLGQINTGWSTDQMAYSFGIGTRAGASTPAQGLGTAHHPGGGTLPWYAVDVQAAPASALATPPAATPAVVRRLPTEVLFPGAPAARWWEFEDRRVDFGLVQGGAADWGRMLLQEFMMLYQNDWFSVPYAVAGGTVCQVEELAVTDVFGQTYLIQPAGAGQRPEPQAPAVLIDNDANRWRLFAQTNPTASGPATTPALYVPATVVNPLVSQPSEQISFRREEATNLVWAVESIVPDGFIGGIDGGKAAVQTAEYLRRTALAATSSAATSSAAYTYQLASTVPENWLPFVPITAADGTQGLEQGVLRRQVPGRTFTDTSSDAYVQPRTSLLQLHAGVPYHLHEHEISPAGLRVEGRNYRARWHDGRTMHWFGRQRGAALAGGSSGLTFDLLKVNATG
jgi:hypothetical protein